MEAIIIATTGFVAWICFTLYLLHKTIEQDGTWYNDLRRNDNMNYKSRAKLTLNKRLDVGRTTLLAIVIGIIIWIITFLLTRGVLTLI